MASALLNFLGGMGTGYVRESERQDLLARQDRQDALREQEFNQTKQLRQMQIDEMARKVDLDKAMAEGYADKPAPVVSGGETAVDFGDGTKDYNSLGADSQDVANSDVRQFNRNQTATQPAAVPDTESATPTHETETPTAAPLQRATMTQAPTVVNGIPYADKVSGLKAAQWVQDNQNSSYTKYMALADKLGALPGGMDAANKFFERARELRKEGVGDGMTLLDSGRPEEAMKLINSVGAMKAPEGAKFVATGTGEDPLTHAPKMMYQIQDQAGKVLVPNVHAAAYGYLFSPLDRSKLEAQATESNAKIAADKSYREALIGTRQNGIDQRAQTAADALAARTGGATGAAQGVGRGAGRGVAAGDGSRESQVLSQVDEPIKAAGANNTLTPQNITAVRNLALQLAKTDPAAPPAQIADAAFLAFSNQGAKTPVPDAYTFSADGSINSAIAHGDGKTYTRTGKADPAALTPEQKDGLKAQIPAFLQGLNREVPGSAALYQQAAFGDVAARAKLFDALAPKVNQDLVRAIALTGRKVTPEQLAAATKKRIDEIIQPRLITLNQFAPRPPTASKSLAAPQNTGKPRVASTQPARVDQPTPSVDPTQAKAARIAELQKQLAIDDKIKGKGWLGWGGMGARAIDARAMPLGVSQRFEIENELKQLGS